MERDEIDFERIILLLNKSKKILFSLLIVGILVSGMVFIIFPKHYSSSVLVAPTTQSQNDLARLRNQIGDFFPIPASSSSGPDKTTKAIAVLKSRKFYSALAAKHNLISDFIVSNKPKVVKNKSQGIENIYDMKLENSYKQYLKNLTIFRDLDTNLIEISFNHIDSAKVKPFLDTLIQEINKNLQLEEIYFAEKSILYLNAELKKASFAETKIVLSNLIENEYQKITIAKTRPEFVFTTIDPAINPYTSNVRERLLYSVIFFILIVFGGAALIVIYDYFKINAKKE